MKRYIAGFISNQTKPRSTAIRAWRKLPRQTLICSRCNPCSVKFKWRMAGVKIPLSQKGRVQSAWQAGELHSQTLIVRPEDDHHTATVLLSSVLATRVQYFGIVDALNQPPVNCMSGRMTSGTEYIVGPQRDSTRANSVVAEEVVAPNQFLA